MNIQTPDYTGNKLYDWLKANKQALVAQKKSGIKRADACYGINKLVDKADANKLLTMEEIGPDANQIKVRSVINTTRLFDSCKDVHFDGLWSKSLQENKENYLVREHDFCFAGVISDEVKAYTQKISWADLGYSYQGLTQALIFDSTITKANQAKDDDGLTMFDRYRMGKVKQHSVGMRYIKIFMAISSKMYEEEYAIWEEYFDQIANKEDAEEAGYFWAVTEGKIIEGSAVLKGANFATPTLSITQSKTEPLQDTPEPVKTTLKASDLSKFYNVEKHI
jgi:hypothetical protein